MKKDERKHIETVGDEKFDAALAKATFEVRQDRRLVGLDIIRGPLAFEAALRATGYPPRGFSLGRIEMPGDIMAICEEVLSKAIQVATVPT